MRTDWNAVKLAYITTDRSLADIAKDFKIKERQLKTHSKNENWVEQRKLWRVTTTNQAAEKRSTEMASDIAQFSSDELKLVKAGFALVAEELKARKPARDIATALKGFQEVRMRATGENPEADKDLTINVKYDN